jgi:hypothetical protein
MSDVQKIHKYPPYVEAVERILERFDKDGYGVIITDQEFDEYMGIEQPQGLLSAATWEKLQLERLKRYKSIEMMLDQHHVCLVRSKMLPGFEILHPRDQVSYAHKKEMDRIKKRLKRATMILMNIDQSLLTMEEEADRQRQMMKMAFIKSATTKRKFEVLPTPVKKLGNG